MLEQIQKQAVEAVLSLLDAAKLQPGDLLVIGCSSSEIIGERIGSASSEETAYAVCAAILPLLRERGVYVAAQCCEHLNRALILEYEAMRALGLSAERVNVVPQPKAGGSFATSLYKLSEHPVAVAHVKADAGLDIGGTLIGMHLKEVAVPVRLPVAKIGEAIVLAARTRLPFVGGVRAVYDENLL